MIKVSVEIWILFFFSNVKRRGFYCRIKSKTSIRITLKLTNKMQRCLEMDHTRIICKPSQFIDSELYICPGAARGIQQGSHYGSIMQITISCLCFLSLFICYWRVLLGRKKRNWKWKILYLKRMLERLFKSGNYLFDVLVLI